MEAVIWFVLSLAGFATAASTVGTLIFLVYLVGLVGRLLLRKLNAGSGLDLQGSPTP